MTSTRPNEIVLKTKAQWAAMASPIRIQIVDRLRMLGAAAVPAVAASLGRRPDGLYHHFRLLDRAGIIRADGWERIGSHAQALYRLAGEIRFPIQSRTGRGLGTMRDVTGALFRSADRGVAAALAKGGLKEAGPEKDLWCRVHTARLGPADLAKVNALFAQVESVLVSAHDRPGDRVFTVLLGLWPDVQGRERANSASRARKSRRRAAKDQIGTPRRIQEGNS